MNQWILKLNIREDQPTPSDGEVSTSKGPTGREMYPRYPFLSWRRCFDLPPNQPLSSSSTDGTRGRGLTTEEFYKICLYNCIINNST